MRPPAARGFAPGPQQGARPLASREAPDGWSRETGQGMKTWSGSQRLNPMGNRSEPRRPDRSSAPNPVGVAAERSENLYSGVPCAPFHQIRSPKYQLQNSAEAPQRYGTSALFLVGVNCKACWKTETCVGAIHESPGKAPVFSAFWAVRERPLQRFAWFRNALFERLTAPRERADKHGSTD